MAFWTRWNEQYQELYKAIIRPPRDEYDIEDLGPTMFVLEDRTYHREDFRLTNPRGMTIHCSHFQPIREERPAERMPCVIYLHGNCSSRMECMTAIKVLLPEDITVVGFDFAGSGKSDGEYVSLGWFERDDLQTVIEHLRSQGTTNYIGLWGRSMGAVTALMHADRDPSIAGMVLDSPFSSLRTLAEELVEVYVSVRLPKWVVGMALGMIKSSIQQRAQFDIDNLQPIRHVSHSYVPAFFIGAKGDKFIDIHHSEDLHREYAGEKQLVPLGEEHDHNSARPKNINDMIALFFMQALRVQTGGAETRRLARRHRQRAEGGRHHRGGRQQPARSPLPQVSPGPGPTSIQSPRNEGGEQRRGGPGGGPERQTRAPTRNEMVPPEQHFHFSAGRGGIARFYDDDDDDDADFQRAIQMSLMETQKETGTEGEAASAATGASACPGEGSRTGGQGGKGNAAATNSGGEGGTNDSLTANLSGGGGSPFVADVPAERGSPLPPLSREGSGAIGGLRDLAETGASGNGNIGPPGPRPPSQSSSLRPSRRNSAAATAVIVPGVSEPPVLPEDDHAAVSAATAAAIIADTGYRSPLAASPDQQEREDVCRLRSSRDETGKEHGATVPSPSVGDNQRGGDGGVEEGTPREGVLSDEVEEGRRGSNLSGGPADNDPTHGAPSPPSPLRGTSLRFSTAAEKLDHEHEEEMEDPKGSAGSVGSIKGFDRSLAAASTKDVPHAPQPCTSTSAAAVWEVRWETGVTDFNALRHRKEFADLNPFASTDSLLAEEIESRSLHRDHTEGGGGGAAGYNSGCMPGFSRLSSAPPLCNVDEAERKKGGTSSADQHPGGLMQPSRFSALSDACLDVFSSSDFSKSTPFEKLQYKEKCCDVSGEGGQKNFLTDFPTVSRSSLSPSPPPPLKQPPADSPLSIVRTVGEMEDEKLEAALDPQADSLLSFVSRQREEDEKKKERGGKDIQYLFPPATLNSLSAGGLMSFTPPATEREKGDRNEVVKGEDEPGDLPGLLEESFCNEQEAWAAATLGDEHEEDAEGGKQVPPPGPPLRTTAPSVLFGRSSLRGVVVSRGGQSQKEKKEREKPSVLSLSDSEEEEGSARRGEGVEEKKEGRLEEKETTSCKKTTGDEGTKEKEPVDSVENKKNAAVLKWLWPFRQNTSPPSDENSSAEKETKENTKGDEETEYQVDAEEEIVSERLEEVPQKSGGRVGMKKQNLHNQHSPSLVQGDQTTHYTFPFSDVEVPEPQGDEDDEAARVRLKTRGGPFGGPSTRSGGGRVGARFGHVSPPKVLHVMDLFGQEQQHEEEGGEGDEPRPPHLLDQPACLSPSPPLLADDWMGSFEADLGGSSLTGGRGEGAVRPSGSSPNHHGGEAQGGFKSEREGRGVQGGSWSETAGGEGREGKESSISGAPVHVSSSLPSSAASADLIWIRNGLWQMGSVDTTAGWSASFE